MDKRIKQQYHSVSLSTKSEIITSGGVQTILVNTHPELTADSSPTACQTIAGTSVGCYVIEITFVYNVC